MLSLVRGSLTVVLWFLFSLFVGRKFLPLLFGVLRPPPKPLAFPFLDDRKGNKRSFKGKEVPLENPFPMRGG